MRRFRAGVSSLSEEAIVQHTFLVRVAPFLPERGKEIRLRCKREIEVGFASAHFPPLPLRHCQGYCRVDHRRRHVHKRHTHYRCPEETRVHIHGRPDEEAARAPTLARKPRRVRDAPAPAGAVPSPPDEPRGDVDKVLERSLLCKVFGRLVPGPTELPSACG